MDNQYSDEIDLKQLGKKVLRIARNRKKIFISFLVAFMLISLAYFIKVMVKPSYKSEVVLKSRFVRKDQLQSIINKYNIEIQDSKKLQVSKGNDYLEKNGIVKMEIVEIKPDITSPDKDDRTKYYKLISFHFQKPNYTEEFNLLIDDIKEISCQDNDIIEGKKRTLEAIAEIDTLVEVAFEAGNSFKDKMNMPGNMMVMNDLYKSLNDILARKTSLKAELSGYSTENIIFKASPLIVSKKVTMPMIIFIIGIFSWFIFCMFWIGGVLVFGEEN
jgi:hypothetical protein